jgi:hypothetical protein
LVAEHRHHVLLLGVSAKNFDGILSGLRAAIAHATRPCRGVGAPRLPLICSLRPTF